METQEIPSSHRPRLMFTGGGTGGHVYPGLSVLEQLRKRGEYEVVGIGSKKGVERTLVGEASVPFLGIPSGKFRREFTFKNVTDLFRVLGGIFVSIYHLKRLNPHLLFSKGGFVSVPPVLAAFILKIPVIAHESDLDPGLATRIALPIARRLLVPFPESVELYPKRYRSKITVTGNPVRDAIFQGNAEEGRKLLGLRKDRPILLVLGGSQGAMEINRLLWSTLPDLLKDMQVVHQVGPLHTGAPELAESLHLSGYVAKGYFKEELPHVLAAADGVVSRAGAGTLWELAALCKPMLLIPLRGSGTRGDQVRNARLFELHGWARAIYDEPIPRQRFLEEVRFLMDTRRAQDLQTNLKQLDVRGAANRIVQVLLEVIQEGTEQNQ
ncbi:MAG: undecaprenyldiphospho-muramoylpentapeptide beta-N-acetylglucosaminyltransferase [Spirochaetes bacterium]|nr:undecaprenyldiphospho-muramoylpentapeptide beta-N-acetylglucosaminyltransferase [Spirochaetota bacterium]